MELEIISRDGRITDIRFSGKEDSKEFSGHDEVTDFAAKEIREYLEGERRDFDFPVNYKGTVFQEKVWKAVLEIPYGETRSYAEIAEAIGNPKAVRAVGTALGKNRLLIVIPCHRVIKKDGTPGKYAAGTEIKKKLLDMEKQHRADIFREQKI